MSANPRMNMPRGISHISVKCLRPSRFNVRADARGDSEISALVNSIAVSGLIEPLIVRRLTDDAFEVIAGERRLAASKRLGLDTIPCIIRKCCDDEALIISLTENLQRSDLNPIEKAQGLMKLREKFRLTQENIGERIGMSQSAIAHYLRLLELPGEVQRLIQDGSLSMGHGKVLAGVGDRKRIVALALKCAAKGSSVRELEGSLSVRPHQFAKQLRRKKEQVELPNGVFLVIKESSTEPHTGTIELPYYSDKERAWIMTVLSRAGGGASMSGFQKFRSVSD